MTLCIFCGSGTGKKDIYARKAIEFTDYLVSINTDLVYGGANVGLMRIIADRMLRGGRKVTGVMPQALVEREVAHENITELHIVKDMQERKALMAKLSDAFVALPGGYGTLDELFEVLSWNQLNMIQKPVGILNIDGYFDPLIALLDKATEDLFLRTEHRHILQVSEEPPELIRKLENFTFKPVEKWIEGLKKGKI